MMNVKPAIVLAGVVFLVAAAVGGLAGSVVREGHFKFSKKQAVAWSRALGNTLAGAVVGLIAAVAYAVGINLVNVKPAASGGEALVFVIAALGALGGTELLRKALPGRKQA